jgi:hypothetical protein
MGLHGKAREKLGGDGPHLVPEGPETQHLVAFGNRVGLPLGKGGKNFPYILCRLTWNDSPVISRKNS